MAPLGTTTPRRGNFFGDMPANSHAFAAGALGDAVRSGSIRAIFAARLRSDNKCTGTKKPAAVGGGQYNPWDD
jgi:hypothetical protein